MKMHWLDRVTSSVAPRWTLNRMKARMLADVIARHYEAASTGRRTQGWRRSSGDVNAVVGPALKPLREVARELVRNNPYASSAVSTIADHAVGWGIVPECDDPAAMKVWEEWAESTACDADGRLDFAGLQKMVIRTVVEAGEIVVRGRPRRASDPLPLPFQVQLLDPDYLDTLKDSQGQSGQPRIVQGVEFDAIGRRVAYWLFPEHPGSAIGGFPSSQRVPAEFVGHPFLPTRTGQVRGPSWFAPITLKLKDLDEMEDATLMKQKIAACLAAFTFSSDGASLPMGTPQAPASVNAPVIDSLGPGAVIPLAHGQDVKVVEPPSVADYDPYTKNVLRAIATGIGVTYEDLTGDYTGMPFSAARMSRIRHWARVEDWRWRLLVPQFCQPAWDWVMLTALIMGRIQQIPAKVDWTAPPAPMIDPVNEGLAYQRNIRNGTQSLSEVLRERGYHPRRMLEQMKTDNAMLDDLGLILDSDPRKTTQAGQLQGAAVDKTADAAASTKALEGAQRALVG
jgi:lambda family phage portal protein